jgi:hypothetical protein
MAALLFAVPAFAENNYTGVWWNASQNGMGISLVHQVRTVSAQWFAYDVLQRPTFFYFAGPLTVDSQGHDVYSGTLFVTHSSQPMGYDASKFRAEGAGTLTMTFTGTYNATFAYAYTDPSDASRQAGTLDLTPYQFACVAPAMWNGTFCAVPMGVKATNPKPVPVGCSNWQDPCWQNSVKNGTVQLISTTATMVGVPGAETRPVMFAYFIDGTGFYRVTVLYADNGEPIAGNGSIVNGLAMAIDSAKGNGQGVLQHLADGTCWQMQWFGPNSTTGNRNVWASIQMPCL